MPIHDWTRVKAGIFHHFHHSWIEEIQRTLNDGRMPPEYYALAEQIAGKIVPDVLALEVVPSNGQSFGNGSRGTIAVAVSPPRVRFTAKTDMELYAFKQKSVAIRHSSDDRIVGLVEIVSPGNKGSYAALREFVEKAGSALWRGYHLLIIDLQPPTINDPNGIHGAIWADVAADDSYRAPPDKPLTVASYDAGPDKTAYVEPVAVGDALPDMPVFLEPGEYVNLPLEATYQAAWRAVPERWRRVLAGPAKP